MQRNYLHDRWSSTMEKRVHFRLAGLRNQTQVYLAPNAGDYSEIFSSSKALDFIDIFTLNFRLLYPMSLLTQEASSVMISSFN